MCMRLIRCAAAILVLGLLGSTTVEAQTSVQQGQTFSLQFDASSDAAQIPVGLALNYQVYLDGTKVATVASTTAVAGVVTVPITPITTTGNHVLRASSQWTVTDSSKWSCATGGCPEAFGTDLAFTVLGTVPNPSAPRNFRIVITGTLSGGSGSDDLKITQLKFSGGAKITDVQVESVTIITPEKIGG